MNSFISYPVGQGFFYSGTIDGFQLVYDCGTERTGKEIERLIDYYKKEVNCNASIDMLVISHFDKDHISGLLYLLKKFNVKKMYIPYYNNPNILYLIDLIITFSGTVIDQLILIEPKLNEEDSVEEILPDDDLREIEIDGIPDSLKNKVFEGKSSFIVKKIKWEFYFFNMPIEKTSELDDWIEDLKETITLEMKKYGVRTVSDLTKKIKPKGIEKLYSDVLESLFTSGKRNMELTKSGWKNNISLCLYHQPQEKKITKVIYKEPTSDICLNAIILKSFCIWPYDNLRDGTLLTGDIKLSGKRLIEFKKWIERIKVKSRVGVIYLPHHGAFDDWDECLKEITHCSRTVSISSAGKNSRHGHPSSTIMMDYKRSGLIHIKCDEDNHFEYRID